MLNEKRSIAWTCGRGSPNDRSLDRMTQPDGSANRCLAADHEDATLQHRRSDPLRAVGMGESLSQRLLSGLQASFTSRLRVSIDAATVAASASVKLMA